MVATAYWYLNLTSEPAVLVDGIAYQGDSAPLMGQSPGTTTPARRRSSNEEKGSSADDMV